MKKIIITGATSMIGSSIIEEAIKHKETEKIYAVVRRGTAKLDRLPADPRIRVIECDADQYGRLPELAGDCCDAFFHIAWTMTGNRNADNIAQADNIHYSLEAIRSAKALGCTTFVGAGSQAEYGSLNLEKISPDSPADPVQPYGIAKYAAGKLVRNEAEKLGMDCLWVRIFSVYGKYDKPNTMIVSTIDKFLHGEHAKFTEGIQLWDYLHASDAGRAFWLIGEKSTGIKVYCLGSGEKKQLKEYIMEMRDIVDPQIPLTFGEVPYGKSSVMNLCADISELEKDTGWKPQISFRDGIREIVDAKRNHR